ncbi:jg22248, partial [Pararge aegeria aegeria]
VAANSLRSADVYPSLVRLAGGAGGAGPALREALLQFGALLSPPL